MFHSFLSPRLLLAFCVCTLPVAAHESSPFSTLNLPSIGVSGSGFVDAQKDKDVAEWALRKLNKTAPQLQDPWLQDELKLMLNGISAQAGLPESLALIIIRDKQINAFATPGGVIGVNTGLITKASSADELASVLAHEVAHISQRHHARNSEHAASDLLVQLGGLVVGALLAKENAEAAQAAMVGSQAYTVDRRLAYSRQHEREADRVGLQLMQAAGYDPTAMPRFFETMQADTASTGYLPSFVLTHPLTLERISETSERASSLPIKPNPYTQTIQLQFAYIYWRTLALQRDTQLAAFAQSYRNNPHPAVALGYVRALLNENESTQAAKVLAQVRQEAANPVLYALSKAEVLLAQKHYTQAVKWLEAQTQLYPEARALKIAAATAYRLTGKAQQAVDVLKPLADKDAHDLLVWQVMSEAAEELPKNDLNQVQALRFRAEAQFWRDDIAGALKSLARAKSLATGVPSQLAKINLRYEQVLHIYTEQN